MLLENFADAESAMVSVVGKDGTERTFHTRMTDERLAYHKWCIDDHVDTCIREGN